MSAPRILLVSNGYGEIAIAETIARAIVRRAPSAVLSHMRLVGTAPQGAWPTPVGPEAEMPSGGLVTYWNFRNIWRDVRAGLLGSVLRQFAFLRSIGRGEDAVVAVGDVYCLAVVLLFARRPTVFVATAKSEHVAGHSRLESAIARGARVTFARDAITADALRRRGVDARYAGNVMMDGTAAEEIDLPVREDAVRFAILPGSRGDAPGNAADAVRRLRLVRVLLEKPIEAFIALAPSVDPASLVAAIDREGFALRPTGADRGAIARGSHDGLDVLAVRGGFGDVLRAAEYVLGQSGTGNEQAAGLGKPVIAAADKGRSTSDVGWYRMRQMRLLGGALAVLPADDRAFADGVAAIVRDPQRAAAMGAAGRERMGGAGGAAAVADAALAAAEWAS